VVSTSFAKKIAPWGRCFPKKCKILAECTTIEPACVVFSSFTSICKKMVHFKWRSSPLEVLQENPHTPQMTRLPKGGQRRLASPRSTPRTSAQTAPVNKQSLSTAKIYDSCMKPRTDCGALDLVIVAAVRRDVSQLSAVRSSRTYRPVDGLASVTSIEARRLRPAPQRVALDS